MKSALSAVCLLGALFAPACGGSPPPPAEEPSLDEPPASGSASVPASNADVEKGMAALEQQDFEAAKTILSEARKKDAKDPQAAFYLGLALEGTGDKAGAEREYRAALDLDAKLADAAVNLSQLLLDAGNPQGALTVVEAALKAAPKHPDLLLNRAVALEGTGNRDAALNAYAAAAAARPKDHMLHAAYGGLLSEAGKGKEAVAELELATASDDPALLASVASVLTKEGAFGACVKAIDKALAAKKVPALLVRRGICKAGQNDEKGATADYEAALALDPKFAPAHHYFGLLLAKKDKKKALEHLDQAASLAGGKGIGPEAKQKAAELRGKK